MKRSAYKTYQLFARDVDMLYNTIKADYKPDYIFGIATGGLFISKLMYERFKKPLGIIFAKRYKGVGKVDNEGLQIRYTGYLQKPFGKVLLVDDICDRGMTLEEVVKYVKETWPNVKEVKTAVLHLKQGSSFKPDYYLYDIAESIWIDYFWEVEE